jgi:hypothetical protein
MGPPGLIRAFSWVNLRGRGLFVHLSAMAIGAVDRRFLENRRERSKFGLWALPTAFLMVVGAWVAFWTFLPLAVNPWLVLGRIEGNTFEPGTLTMYAILFTVLVNVVFVLLCTFVLFALLWVHRERRYLKLTSAAAAAAAAATATAETSLPPS